MFRIVYDKETKTNEKDLRKKNLKSNLCSHIGVKCG